jgi:hypothetical protein
VNENTQSVPAGWYSDPTNVHDHRYYDGSAWTCHVSDKGISSEDPDLTIRYFLHSPGGQREEFTQERMEWLESTAPLVADRIRVTQHMDWGWIAQRLASIGVEGHIFHSQKCRHEGNKGMLVGTTTHLIWMVRTPFMQTEFDVGYDWDLISTTRFNPLFATVAAVALVANGHAASGFSGRLHVGPMDFEMHAEYAEYYAALIRQYQKVLAIIADA